MMDVGGVLFYGVGIVWFIFFLRIVWVNLKIRKRIKKLYPKFWEENMLVLFAGFGFAKDLIPKLLKEVEDPIMRHYKEQWDSAFKQMIIAIFITIVMFIGYIAIFVGF